MVSRGLGAAAAATAAVAALGVGVASRARRKAAAKATARFTPPAPLPFVAALAETKVVSRLEDARPNGVVSQPLIGTHDGTFHCDEACAIALLKMLPAYEAGVVVRSRDPQVLEGCDVVVDVGAVYESTRHRYDHHQRGFDGTMAELGHGTKLSSFGLVYRHFGRELVQRLAAAVGTPDAELDGDAIYRRVYKAFVEHIDGIDNGVETFQGGVRNYEVTTTLSDRVGSLNPSWNEPASPAEANARFAAAVALAGGEVAAHVEACIRSWWPARAIVKAALDGAGEQHPSRQVLVLERYCPWASHLFQLEKELAAAGDPAAVGAAKYVVFKDARGPDWRVQAVPVAEESFTSRLQLPEAWRGLRDEKLSEVAGIEGCVFVHSAGFIGGHSGREGALSMARKAIDL